MTLLICHTQYRLYSIMAVLVMLLGACVTPLPASAQMQQASASKALPSNAAAASPQNAPATIQLLKVAPETGYVGDSFTITGKALPPNKAVEFIWATANGSYVTQASAENVEFYKKKFDEYRLSLGKTTTNAQGQVSASFTVPEDYGEVHDIFAVVDDQDVAKGGYRILRDITVSPTEGPLGTPMTIRVTGLGWKTYESTIAVRYDNSFTGIMTAVTTRGTAAAVMRAAGGVGKHVIDINHGAKSVPYLNNQQSGTAHIPDHRFWFTVTEDAGPLPFSSTGRMRAVSSRPPISQPRPHHTALRQHQASRPSWSLPLDPSSPNLPCTPRAYLPIPRSRRSG